MVANQQAGPFKITTEGVKQYLIALNRFGELVEFLGPETWDKVAEVFFDTELKIFESGGFPNKFVSLSKKYGMWKALHYPGLPIMTREGILKDALSGRGSVPGKAVTIKRIISRKDAQGVTVGVRSKYGYAHQKGLGHLPVREIIQTTAAEKIQFAKVLQVALVRIERESFGGLKGSTI